MNTDKNVHIVKACYDAFRRGAIPELLALLSPDISFEPIIGAAPHVPMRGRRQGVGEVAAFFKTLGENCHFDVFEPREFIAQGDQVAVVGHYHGTATPTGRRLAAEWVMVFTIRHGKVVQFREFADTSSINAAFDKVPARVAALR